MSTTEGEEYKKRLKLYEDTWGPMPKLTYKQLSEGDSVIFRFDPQMVIVGMYRALTTIADTSCTYVAGPVSQQVYDNYMRVCRVNRSVVNIRDRTIIQLSDNTIDFDICLIDDQVVLPHQYVKNTLEARRSGILPQGWQKIFVKGSNPPEFEYRNMKNNNRQKTPPMITDAEHEEYNKLRLKIINEFGELPEVPPGWYYYPKKEIKSKIREAYYYNE